MQFNTVRRSALLFGVAVAALSAASAAYAQVAENPQTGSDSAALEEVVVTATRQADTVNRVPLAVSAQTQRNLDQRGIRTIADLQSTVPGLRLTATEGSGVATISIRGVRQQLGAATTGFYLDETPLQKRNAAGFASINGTPVPPLFDLDRVEVLRGPQGTLFGGGSEGGTVRYIQPQPSLTRYSVYARAQYTQTEHGDPSYEAGVAVGGPIVQDKLGFRASIFQRHTGGFIDLTHWRTGQVYDEDANEGKIRMGRFALTLAPTEKSRLTFSYFASKDESKHNSTTFNLDMPGTVTVPSLCYDTIATAAMPVGAPNRVIPRAFASGPSCAGRVGQPGIYVAPGYTVGPFNLKPYQSLALGQNPTNNQLQVASLDAEYELTPDLTIRSITSYLHDLGKAALRSNNIFQTNVNYSAGGGAIYQEPGQAPLIFQAGLPYNPNITVGPNQLLTGAYGINESRNKRYGMTQEVRLSSNPSASWGSFVAGVFYSNMRAFTNMYLALDERGFIQQSGLGNIGRFSVNAPYFSNIIETDKDVEIAGFAETTLKFGEHFRATGGIRLTHITTDFWQTNFGPNGFTLTPKTSDGTLVIGSISEDPVTPKASLQYLITPDDLLYVTAAKGFRAGGVNQVFSASGQAQLFAQYGLTKDIFPITYQSDSVWSYELGGKFRLWNGRAQLNMSLYRIDWTNVQSNVIIGGDGIVVNAPSARSEGFEVEGQVRPIRNLTLNGSVAYDKAKYTSSVVIPSARPGGLPLNAVLDGWALPFPKWSFDFGARYDMQVTSAVRGYARVDYRWADSYLVFPVGHPSYSPDSSIVPSSQNVNARIGFEFKDFDVNFFVNNLTDEHKGQFGAGRSQCLNLACSSYNQFNPARTVNWGIPRQWGIQIAYRH